MIAYALTWLRENGVTDVAINLHYKPAPLRAYVGDGSAFGLRVSYSHEERLLGSAGALVPLRRFFGTEEPFVVAYGDVLTDIDLAPVLTAHRMAGAEATLVLTRVDDPRRAGMVELDADGWIRRLVEKPAYWTAADAWANGGIYVVGPRIWEFLPSGGAADFAFDVFPTMLAAGCRLYGIRSNNLVLDIGSHERLAEAEALVAAGRVSRPEVATSC